MVPPFRGPSGTGRSLEGRIEARVTAALAELSGAIVDVARNLKREDDATRSIEESVEELQTLHKALAEQKKKNY